MVGNVGLWPAKTFERRRVTQDLRNGGPLEMLTIAKLIKKIRYCCISFGIQSLIYIICAFKAKFA